MNPLRYLYTISPVGMSQTSNLSHNTTVITVKSDNRIKDEGKTMVGEND